MTAMTPSQYYNNHQRQRILNITVTNEDGLNFSITTTPPKTTTKTTKDRESGTLNRLWIKEIGKKDEGAMK